MILRYTRAGYIFISPGDDPRALASALVETDYREEFCVAADFSENFLAGLMAAGFLVMSIEAGKGEYLLLPKFHLERAIVDFSPDPAGKDAFHESQSARRLIPRYEFAPGADFDRIIDRCAAFHGDDWLTPPLIRSVKSLRTLYTDGKSLCPFSFALYRDGKLAAGEFGVVSGRVYTSYSGYRDENSAGTVQMILTARWLRDRNFTFWDLGMPMDYKTRLGARNLGRRDFLDLFRTAQI